MIKLYMDGVHAVGQDDGPAAWVTPIMTWSENVESRIVCYSVWINCIDACGVRQVSVDRIEVGRIVLSSHSVCEKSPPDAVDFYEGGHVLSVSICYETRRPGTTPS
jgi:hypothetical protein